MKKRKLNSKLNFRKLTISNLKSSSLKGGTGNTTDQTYTNCDGGCISLEHLCEFTFYSACTGPSEPGVGGCQTQPGAGAC